MTAQRKSWSLTSLQQRLVKTGERLIKHARYYWLLLAESGLTRRLFAAMVRRITALPVEVGGKNRLRRMGDGGVRMEVAESMQLVGFEILEQAEGGVWRGKGAAGYKKSQPAGSKGNEWMYTQLCSGAQNGNPGPVAHVPARS